MVVTQDKLDAIYAAFLSAADFNNESLTSEDAKRLSSLITVLHQRALDLVAASVARDAASARVVQALLAVAKPL